MALKIPEGGAKLKCKTETCGNDATRGDYCDQCAPRFEPDQTTRLADDGQASTRIRPGYYKALIPAREVVVHERQSIGEEDLFEVECFSLIDALGLDFYTGNILKYLWRAGKKDNAAKAADLKKIVTYAEQALQREGE